MANPVTPAEYSKIGVLIFGSMVIVSLWIAYDGAAHFLVPAYRAQSVFVQTEATVLETDLDVGRHKGQERSHPRLRLSYDAGGQVCEEWTYLNWAEPSTSRKEAEMACEPPGRRPGDRVVRPGPARLGGCHPDVGFAMGWTMVGFGLLLPVPTIIVVIVAPLIALVFRARRGWFILERRPADCRRGGPRGPDHRSTIRFSAGSRGGYTTRAEPHRAEIKGKTFFDRLAAEAALPVLLAPHTVGEQRPLWYDPSGRTEPTFKPPLTFGGILMEGTLILLRPVLMMIAGAFELGSSAWRA